MEKAMNQKWHGSSIREFDGREAFVLWRDDLKSALTQRRAGWLLEESRAGDADLQTIVLSVLRQ